MNLRKKQRERRSPDDVLKRFAVVPAPTEETEERDFLLTIEGVIVGAEVATLV